MNKQALKISQLADIIKKYIDQNNYTKNLFIEGEISNFTKSSAGYLYFTLKDDKSSIPCVMFDTSQTKDLELKNGDLVYVLASVSFYTNSSRVQLYINKIKLQGLGNLYLEFEKLKKLLASKGYFDPIHKKPKPRFPLNIAVVCGKDSAALSDIQSCLKRRWPLAKVTYYPVLVQGNQAVKDITQTLIQIDDLNYQAIILARGGGSIEDLWCFNNQELAMTIFNLKTFIITGIGHQQDFTIADFVADLRAPTPTGAVELLVPKQEEVLIYLNQLYSLINHHITNQLKSKEINLLKCAEKINNLTNIFKEKINNITIITNNNRNQTIKHINKYIEQIKIQKTKINSISKHKFDDYLKQLKHLNINLNNNILHYKQIQENNLINLNKIIKSYNPHTVIDRGYALLYFKNNVKSSIHDFNIDDVVDIVVKNGTIKAKIQEIKDGKLNI